MAGRGVDRARGRETPERPTPGDPADLSDRTSPAYWRREADLALSEQVVQTSGLRAPGVQRVVEDATGISLWTPPVEQAETNGLYLARALGVFAGQSLQPRSWWCRDLLGDRLARQRRRGGWPTLARTTLADVADRLWLRREHHLQTLSVLPQVPSHGDPTSRNLAGRHGSDVLAVDWGWFGGAPVGADVGYLSLAVREDLEVLVEAYADGLAESGRPDWAEPARTGAGVAACYTALGRVEWALARVAERPGALAGKVRHPAVAPHIRTLQSLFDTLERLL